VYQHILIPTDGSPLSEQAIRQAITLAQATKARVTALTVSAPFRTFATDPVIVTDTPQEYEKDCAARAEGYLCFVRDAAARAGVPYDGLHVIAEHPYAAIIETATQRGCDLICMASHGRKGLSALLLGSETVKVLTHTKIATLVCR